MMLPLLLAVDFMNFTYNQNPCAGNVNVPVVMRNGSFSWMSSTDPSWGFEFHVDRVVQGSLKPGTRQAVVVIACDAPVDGGAAEAYLYDERKNGATFVAKVGEADWGSDWGEPPTSIHIRFTDKFLYVDQCLNVSECDAADYIVTTYALREGKIVKVYEETHKRKFP
jgi:hypothetical protein